MPFFLFPLNLAHYIAGHSLKQYEKNEIRMKKG